MPWSSSQEEEDAGDEFINPGSGHAAEDPEHGGTPRRHSRLSALRHAVRGCCRNDHHRWLSIMSIVCGLSCIGIVALKYSVKSEERQKHDPGRAAAFARKAKKFSIISIVVLFVIMATFPGLMALVSYLATFKD
ncbi:transmembrane protein 265-like [Eucyclogobius newberryi]|uniref:transmembrane protein 265-like n=1 Tax=Eucyclogobius newberryi TaxID=166745 RepID=UPI003B592E8B